MTGLTRPVRAPAWLRRLPVQPTRFGLAFAALTLLTFIGCVNYQLSLGYFLTFLLGGVWVVSAGEAWRAARLARADVRAGPDVFAGDDATFPVRGQPGSVARAGGALAPLDEYGAGVLQVPTDARGLLHLRGVCVDVTDPLGLWTASASIPANGAVTVYPRPEVNAPDPPGPALQAGGSGTLRARGDEEFAGLREYRPGDSRRRVSWRHATRPGGGLLVREYDAPATPDVQLRWTDTPAHLGTEGRLSRLSAWVVRAGTAGRPFTLVLPDGTVGPGSGEAHAARCLARLAVHGTAGLAAEDGV
ncbi:DUF58 domain-containing protein [Deinococcus maricopensis]|uniref:Uncharacterized protein n=1 Tax=Deinococcus maricopensis (strain DSM 21211 / LMG 22137 / NRRL B-23946 / LB-34) TaxID=709986 RepID=E8U6E2_DEIML|nr:DUF58 domain-containing protein [Deinococcus maricopensis]ADV66631.1 protein of unknown function DUF58 [Deinococcus maricopensis DSM 21211]